MATLTKGTTFSSGDTVTPAKLNDLVDDATVTFATDDIATASIQSGAVTALKLATDAVETLKIKDANVTADKLATGAVTGAAGGGKLAASAIKGQTSKASPLGDDEVLIHSAADLALRRSTLTAVGTLIAGDLGKAITFGTSTSASGTTVDFTGIPAWATRITIMFNGLSLSGTDKIVVQAGTSSDFVTSGYNSHFGNLRSGGNSEMLSITSGWGVWSNGANNTHYGTMTLIRMTGNTWISTHTGGYIGGSSDTFATSGGGSVALGAALDRVRITTNGSNTFDAGTVNIAWES
jgi:hypothetical protein